MARKAMGLAVLGGALVMACGSGSKSDDDASPGGGAGMPAAGSGGAAGAGGSAGATSGGKAGAGAGSAGLSGSAGAPDVGTFTGLTGIQHRLGMMSGARCVADTAGVVTCDSSRQRPPGTAFASFGLGLDTSGESGCGLTATGEVSCWGGDVGAPPAGPYTAIAVGDENACGVRPNGSITCFGKDDALNEPPTGQFTDVSVENEYACALAVDGHVECWGPRASSRGTRVDGTFRQVAVGGGMRCTLDMAGAVACAVTLRGTAPTGTFTQIAVGSGHVCGLRDDGSVMCWGEDVTSRLAPPAGTFVEVSSFDRAVCARTAAGTAECWGQGYGDGGSVLACESSQALLTGTLEGDAFSLDASASLQSGFDDPAGFRWTFSTYTSEGDLGGLITLDGAVELQGAPETSLMNGQTVDVERAFIQTGASETSAGAFYCSANGSTAKLNVDELSVTLSNLHALGGCPGTPVEGELTVCPRCGPALGGTVEGHTFDASSNQATNIGALGGLTTMYLEDGSYAAVQKADDGSLAWGIVATSPGSVGAGAVYCAGSGSTWVVSDNSTVSTLKGLSRLDDCPTTASGDSLTGCIR